MHLRKAQPGSINGHESSWAVFALKSCQAPTVPSPVSLLRQTNRVLNESWIVKVMWFSRRWAPWTWFRWGLYEHSLYATGSIPLWFPTFIPDPQFLSLASFLPLGWGGRVHRWIDRWPGGREGGGKDIMKQAFIHRFIFLSSKIHPTFIFFYFLKENKNHLPSHHLERVTFGWIFYSFNFWERQWKHDFFFSFGKSINLLFSTQCCLPRSLNFRMLPKFQEHIFKARSTARILGRGSPSCVLVTQRRERPFSAPSREASFEGSEWEGIGEAVTLPRWGKSSGSWRVFGWTKPILFRLSSYFKPKKLKWPCKVWNAATWI